ncbi:hypothetical protein [Vibrio splendidus]|uniref:hypothetical protein n=1 Tax=Vibrio splendidus TaxID=29497 RepID=UPI00076A72F8|nr:hypothetical protein [Vibrio splendidus]
MSSFTTKIITSGFIIVALMSYVIKDLYISHYSPESVFLNQYWSYKHRGYPSRFGYLAQLWDIRVVETESEVLMSKDKAYHAMHFNFFGQTGSVAQVMVKFETQWQRFENNHVQFDVIADSIRLDGASDKIDEVKFKSFSRDMLLSMFSTPRKIISVSSHEIITELPYIGLVRQLKIETPHLLEAR